MGSLSAPGAPEPEQCFTLRFAHKQADLSSIEHEKALQAPSEWC